jgi:RNA polymerase sigma-70 factor (sigma-E family)
VSVEEEFTEFVHGAWTDLMRVAVGLTGDQHSAEDLLQTTLARVYLRWKQARVDSPFRYARQALVNAYVSSMRPRWRSEVPTDRPDARPVSDPSNETTERVTVAAALARLSKAQRAVLVLRFLEDLSVAETARLMSCSEGTVRSRTNRALAALKMSGALDGAEVREPEALTHDD